MIELKRLKKAYAILEHRLECIRDHDEPWLTCDHSSDAEYALAEAKGILEEA